MHKVTKIKVLMAVALRTLILSSFVALSLGASASAITPCGDPGNEYKPSIGLGCQNKGNPIADAAFGIINFLSDGVGIVVVASLIWAGIQYAASRGDPQAVAQAVKRIRSNVTALLIFIFAYAILNYIIPGAVLK